jgi:hypothetical protein
VTQACKPGYVPRQKVLKTLSQLMAEWDDVYLLYSYEAQIGGIVVQACLGIKWDHVSKNNQHQKDLAEWLRQSGLSRVLV